MPTCVDLSVIRSMGDETAPARSSAGHVESKTLTTLSSEAGQEPSTSSDRPPTTQDEPLSPSQRQMDASQPFSSQLDLSSLTASSSRSGAFNHTPVTQALPQGGYHQGQHRPRAQHRYNPANPPPMMHQMHPMAPYGGHPPMPLAGQTYYSQQPPHTGQPYGHGQGPPQMQPNLAHRQGMAYYPSQMVMNHSQPVQYYYAQPGQYHAHPHTGPPPISSGHHVPAPLSMSHSHPLAQPSEAARRNFRANSGAPGTWTV